MSPKNLRNDSLPTTPETHGFKAGLLHPILLVLPVRDPFLGSWDPISGKTLGVKGQTCLNTHLAKIVTHFF